MFPLNELQNDVNYSGHYMFLFFVNCKFINIQCSIIGSLMQVFSINFNYQYLF